jgi:hypothetical protein
LKANEKFDPDMLNSAKIESFRPEIIKRLMGRELAAPTHDISANKNKGRKSSAAE